jgi:hypothetical protein
MKHEVREGSYDPMFVSLNFLARRYGSESDIKLTEKL